MRHPTRRTALLVVAACGVPLLGAVLAFRDDLSFHYHVWRLDRALTLEDARPWLEKLEGHVHNPTRAQRLVSMLGPQRPRLTFWLLQWPSLLPHVNPIFRQVTRYGEKLGLGILVHPRLGTLLHFARSLEHRVRRDGSFFPVMAHFMRWQKHSGDSWLLLDQFQQQPHVHMSLDFKELLRRSLEDQEAHVRIQETWLLGQAWLLGMSPLPLPLELSFPLTGAEIDRLNRRWDDLLAWVRARRDRLRFDSALGRFVRVSWWGHGSPEMPRPTEPLPGWTGPVPQVP